MYFVLFMLLVFLWRDVFLKEYYISKSFVHYEIVFELFFFLTL
jgi:hypothetical protein